MFVLEALLLTFATTPLVTILYPPNKRTRVAATGANFNNVADGDEAGRKEVRQSGESGDIPFKTRFTVVLDRLEHLPGMMALAQLVQPSLGSTGLQRTPSSSSGESTKMKRSTIASVEALRLIELSDRVSAVMKSSASDTLLHTDPLLAIFRMFGQLHDLTISTTLSIVTFDDLAYTVTEHARNSGSDMIMLPWLPPFLPSADGYNNAHDTIHHPSTPNYPSTPKATSPTINPFEALFRAAGGHGHGGAQDTSSSALHSHFVRGVFSRSATDVALFVDQQNGPGMHSGSSQHLLVPFFGGPDDRLALDFVAQLCENHKTTATVLRVTKKEIESPVASLAPAHQSSDKVEESGMLTVASVSNKFVPI